MRYWWVEVGLEYGYLGYVVEEEGDTGDREEGRRSIKREGRG